MNHKRVQKFVIGAVFVTILLVGCKSTTATQTPTPSPISLTPTKTHTPTLSPIPPTPMKTYTPIPDEALPTGMIGDFVWNDANRDGLQNDGEMGVHRITVRLFDADNNLVGTTSTNEEGYYEFVGSFGRYFLEFVIPLEISFTKQAVGDNDEIDSDADPVTGRTNEFDQGADGNQMKWDAGILASCESCHPPSTPPAITKTPTISPTPTATPTRWVVITHGGKRTVTATFTDGMGECGYPTGFETSLEITVNDDLTMIEIFQPSTGDLDVGQIDAEDGFFVAQRDDEKEGYEGHLNADWSGEASYYYIDVNNCKSQYLANWEPINE